MLIGVDPLVEPDLLHVLSSIGHGDEIAVVDANFPATRRAQRVVLRTDRRLAGVLTAVISVLSLDDFGNAVFMMQVVDDRHEAPSVTLEIKRLIRTADHLDPITALPRRLFYDRTERCFAIVATGEARLFGNVILRKGVVHPSAIHEIGH